MWARASLLVLTMAGTIPSAAIMAAEPIVLQGREIRVRDLARLDDIDRARFGSLVAATIPAGRNQLDLDNRQRATLLRRRVPGHDLPLRTDGIVRFKMAAAAHMAARTASPRECFALRHDIGTRDYLDASNLQPVPCRDLRRSAALRFDRRVNAAALSAPLPAGAYLGRISAQKQRVVAAGSQLRLVITDGPVTVERKVRAMQPARMGRTIFVRGEERNAPVFSSRLAVPVGDDIP